MKGNKQMSKLVIKDDRFECDCGTDDIILFREHRTSYEMPRPVNGKLDWNLTDSVSDSDEDYVLCTGCDMRLEIPAEMRVGKHRA